MKLILVFTALIFTAACSSTYTEGRDYDTAGWQVPEYQHQSNERAEHAVRSSVVTSDIRYIGALVVRQNHITDDIAARCGWNIQRCGPLIWDAVKQGSVQLLPDERLELFLYRNGEKTPIDISNGYASVPFDYAGVQSGTQACVLAPEWAAVAYQRRAPANNVVGTCGSGMMSYFDSGRGRDRRETYALVLVRAAGG